MTLKIVEWRKFVAGMWLLLISSFILASFIKTWNDVSLVLLCALCMVFGWVIIVDGSEIHPKHR